MMTKRIALIDIAKGMSIILVAFHHSQIKFFLPYFDHILALFRMPLFFFLAGVFFSTKDRPLRFFSSKTDALLKPYFVTLGVVFLIDMLLGDGNLYRLFKNILYGNGEVKGWWPLWFLTHLWAVFIVTYLVFYYTKLEIRSNFTKFMVVAGLLIAGSVFVDAFWNQPVSIQGKEKILHGLPFSLDIVFLSMAFFISGNFLKQTVKEFVPNLLVLSAAVLSLMIISIITQAEVNFAARIYAEPVFATIAAVAGIYAILSISYYFSENKFLTGVFTTFGSASLFILIFHAFISKYTSDFLSFMLSQNDLLFIAVISFTASIIIPLFIKVLILKSEFLMLFYFPLKSNKLLDRMINNSNERGAWNYHHKEN